MRTYYIARGNDYPELLDQEMKFMTDYLLKLDSREAVVNEAFRITATRFQAGKMAATKFLDVLSTGWQDILNSLGLVHCTNQSYLLAVLLGRNNRFVEDNIERRWASIWGIIPHQYLMVRVDEKFIEIDPWAAKYGLVMGDHARGWHTGRRRKNDISNLKI